MDISAVVEVQLSLLQRKWVSGSDRHFACHQSIDT